MIDSTPHLEGFRVLDFTQYLAGPSCTRLLAEMGADVIKVEIAPLGDPIRANPPRRGRRSGYFVQQNRGKRSLCVDLGSPEAEQIIKDLIPSIDVVVENFSPGVMARRSLDYEQLRAINPQIVMASISGFGQEGPLSHKTSFDLIAQGFAGLMHVTGEPDGAPQFVGAGIADCTAGFTAFAAIGYALLRRTMTGEGSHIDVSMVDSLFHMHEMNVHAPSMTNGEWKPMRAGRHHPVVCPGGAFKGPQDWIIILATQGQIGGLWEAMGRVDLADDPRCVNNNTRLENLDSFVALVEEWMATFDTDDEVLAALEARRVPCGPVLDPSEAVNHPYFQDRNMVREISDPLAGEFTVPGFPIKFSDAAPEPDLVTPNLGQHNHDILRDLCGYDDTTITTLQQQGILVSKNR
ncbi:MAG: CoA transferase [Actinomycetota bacterium]|nr:CoA transferase [Actinomycetota bacterium]